MGKIIIPQIDKTYYMLYQRLLTDKGLLYHVIYVTIKDVRKIEKEKVYPRGSVPEKERRKNWTEYECHIVGELEIDGIHKSIDNTVIVNKDNYK